jgi:hypothetical protein
VFVIELTDSPFVQENTRMDRPIDIVEVERVAGCGIIVTFSDGTLASFASEELEALRPYREPAELAESN